MSSNTHKSAAVPFINQKGERSMKKVKVERYVAGKKPAYAKEDEEEEYYTEEEDDDVDEEYDEEEEPVRTFRTGRGLDYSKQDDDDSSASNLSDNERPPSQIKHDDDEQSDIDRIPLPDAAKEEIVEDDDEEDDPRFRRLKQIESKTNASQLIIVQRTQQIQTRYELKNVVLDEDDNEDEIRQRHAAARKRQLEVPSGLLAGSSKITNDDEEDDDDSQNAATKPPERLETDDLLKDLKLTGISRPMREKLKTQEEEEAEERRLKDMIEQAKQEASFTRKINEKVDEDIRKEVEKEALAKGDIGAREMTSVNTDDEDDELAYEEWKLREIKRVLRDRSERMLMTNVR